MAVIYEPKGRALEYSALACNLYLGCTHGCKYCFAPSCMRKTPNQWHADANPRKDIIQSFEKEARKLADTGEKRPILFCFLSDPYQPEEKKYRLTHQTLSIVAKYGLKSKILTKGHADIIEPDLPTISGDATQLQQVLLNLLINARDALSSNTENPRITLRAQAMRESTNEWNQRPEKDLDPKNYVCIKVKDNGCGIDKETQQKIFEPFFTTKEVGKGTGMAQVVVGLGRGTKRG